MTRTTPPTPRTDERRDGSSGSLDLTVDSAGLPLAGTLLLPDGPGPHPAALLLPGSGPVDRDSSTRRMPMDITRQLAVALCSAGVATLRYDKRGVGGSPGDWRAAGFVDNADDAAAAFAALAARPEVDADRVVLVGHSEGALHATVLAARPVGAAGAVLLSPSATPGEELLVWQAEQLQPSLPGPVRALMRLFRTDLVTQVRRNHAKVKATTADVARIGGVRVNARWTREFMAYDPRVDLARVQLPVLALTGSKDLQVRPGDLQTIAELVPGPVETELVPDVSHLLRTQPGEASLRRYREEVRRPLDERVVRTVVGWVVRHVAPDVAPG